MKKELKKWFERVLLLDWYHRLRNERRDRRLAAIRQQNFPALRKLVSPKTSVITTTCFAGQIFQDLHLEYHSPTLGLYFIYPVKQIS